MLYRENGQFKTSYRADQQIFPIGQDRALILALVDPALAGVLFGSVAGTACLSVGVALDGLGAWVAGWGGLGSAGVVGGRLVVGW